MRADPAALFGFSWGGDVAITRRTNPAWLGVLSGLFPLAGPFCRELFSRSVASQIFARETVRHGVDDVGNRVGNFPPLSKQGRLGPVLVARMRQQRLGRAPTIRRNRLIVKRQLHWILT